MLSRTVSELSQLIVQILDTAFLSLPSPSGGLGTTDVVNLWLIGKRVADFLLVLIELFSLRVTAEALRAKIDRKSAISLQRGQFDPKFQVEGDILHQSFLHSEVLHEKRKFIIDNIYDISPVLDHFLSASVISFDQRDEMMIRETRSKRTSELVNVPIHCHPPAVEEVCNALALTGYEFVVDELKTASTDTSIKSPVPEQGVFKYMHRLLLISLSIIVCSLTFYKYSELITAFFIYTMTIRIHNVK